MFEWDTRKAAANANKHGVTFEEAATVFDDSQAVDGGRRLGGVENIRIISARQANRKERAGYAAAAGN